MAGGSVFGGFMEGFAGGFGMGKKFQYLDSAEERAKAKEGREAETHDIDMKTRKLGLARQEKEQDVLDKELAVRGAKADFNLNEQRFLGDMQQFEQETRRLLEKNKRTQAGMEARSLSAAAANQPDELKLARDQLSEKIVDSFKRQTANLWSLLKTGNKSIALELYNNSHVVAPAEKAKDFRLEGEGDQRVLVVVPKGKGQERRIPVSALEQLENQYGAKYEKAGSSIVRIGRDGKVVPVYEGGKEVAAIGDTGELFVKKGPGAGTRIPAAGGLGGEDGAGGGGSGPLPSSQAASRIDNRVKMAIDKVIMPRYGGRFEGGLFFPDEANKDVATRATQIAGELVRRGMAPEAAGVKAVEQAEREKKLKEAGGAAGAGGAGEYSGPKPWKR